ncbi:hypothetical protein ACO22_01774 [Paracoccidioides brasiliensis]|uniref:Uncharacterized protein n=1 Tax=Paracoccidioides brasiliensis TaxID=121759 RepID=A0A1D2JKL8_PARBR|nr:hypothetical protein ACO22_01774 [Paracoccidioides brasiliensis]
MLLPDKNLRAIPPPIPSSLAHPLSTSWPRITADPGRESLDLRNSVFDLNSALAYGGNKTRTLEQLVAEGHAQGCATLVSNGGVQSNHARQADCLGGPSRPGALGRVGRNPGYETVGNMQFSRICTLTNLASAFEHKIHGPRNPNFNARIPLVTKLIN